MILQTLCICGGAFLGGLAAMRLRSAYLTFTAWRRERSTSRARALVRTADYQTTQTMRRHDAAEQEYK